MMTVNVEGLSVLSKVLRRIINLVKTVRFLKL